MKRLSPTVTESRRTARLVGALLSSAALVTLITLAAPIAEGQQAARDLDKDKILKVGGIYEVSQTKKSKPTIQSCVRDRIPESVLGVSLAAAVPSGWIYGLVYLGTVYAECVLTDPDPAISAVEIRSMQIDVTDSERAEIMKMTNARLSALKSNIAAEVDKTKAVVSSIIQDVRRAGDAERESISRLGREVSQELLLEIEKLKNLRVVIEETIVDSPQINPSPK
jgi:vacuolar-type H+-ATPase subunit H